MKTNNEIMPKVRRSVTLSEETMAWINEQIKRKRFKDVSHALEYAIYQLIEEDREEKQPPRTRGSSQ